MICIGVRISKSEKSSATILWSGILVAYSLWKRAVPRRVAHIKAATEYGHWKKESGQTIFMTYLVH